jgi:hypothetical protein
MRSLRIKCPIFGQVAIYVRYSDTSISCSGTCRPRELSESFVRVDGMSRRTRFALPGEICHLISRFVAQAYLIETPAERRAYVCTLGLHLVKSDWRCFSFAIMSNHIHLGMLAGNDSLASWMRPAHTKFAQWTNEQRERIGAVFVRGPNISLYPVDRASHLISYIHRNPVRAQVVASAAESDWTSHRAYMGLAYKPTWLDVGLGLQLAGVRDGRQLDALVNATDLTREDLDSARLDQPKTPGRRRRGDPRSLDLETETLSTLAKRFALE